MVTEANLRQAIKKNREQARQRRPWPRSGFQVVATLVQKFRLSFEFIEELENLDRRGLLQASLEAPACQPAWFPLLPRGQFEVAQALLARYANPYLIYSVNPFEIRISRELADKYPDLPPARLSTRSVTAIYQELLLRDDV